LKTKKYYETNEFKKINREWEQKLKESGFIDIEEPKRRNTPNIQKQEIKYCEKQENHFDMCREYLNSGKIKDETYLYIFNLYCEGFDIRTTELKLSKMENLVKFKKSKIAYIIDEILEDVYG
jgi:hypothetical protein